ncbi:MAG: YceI family protein [Cyclobacteriaceae bacterium]
MKQNTKGILPKLGMIGLALALTTSPVFSQKKIDMGDRFQINKDGSFITFTTTMGGFPVIKGSLKAYQATMFYDPEDVMNSSATIRIGSDGFTTSHDKRDTELLGENFLDSENFPGIWFQGSDVKLTDKGFDLSGNLNIKNITKPATIQIEKPTVMRKAMNLQDLMIVKGKLTINRKDFDLGTTGPWGANPMLGDEVEIEFSFLGTSYTIDYLQATFVNEKDGRENPVGLVYNDVKANGVDSGLKLVKTLSKDSKYKSDNWPTNLANIGWILMVDGYGKESLPFYEMALKKKSGHLPSLLRLADAYTIAEQYEDALAHLEKEWALPARARFTHIPHLMKALSGEFELKDMK